MQTYNVFVECLGVSKLHVEDGTIIEEVMQKAAELLIETHTLNDEEGDRNYYCIAVHEVKDGKEVHYPTFTFMMDEERGWRATGPYVNETKYELAYPYTYNKCERIFRKDKAIEDVNGTQETIKYVNKMLCAHDFDEDPRCVIEFGLDIREDHILSGHILLGLQEFAKTNSWKIWFLPYLRKRPGKKQSFKFFQTAFFVARETYESASEENKRVLRSIRDYYETQNKEGGPEVNFKLVIKPQEEITR